MEDLLIFLSVGWKGTLAQGSLQFLSVSIPVSFLYVDIGVLMKSIGAQFLRADALPSVNHMRGMQYKIVHNVNNVNKILHSD